MEFAGKTALNNILLDEMVSGGKTTLNNIPGY